MKKGLAVLLCLVASFGSCNAHAVKPHQSGDPHKTVTATSANTASNDEELIDASFTADNRLQTGLKVNSSMDFSSGQAGANFAVYGIARGEGAPGSWGVHDIVGVHGTALKEQAFWAAAMHADVYDSFPGGTSIGLNIEFPQTQDLTNTYGINMQPRAGAKGIVGLQIQNPEGFAYSLKVPNMSLVFGQVDNSLFGMRFNQQTQALELFRNIGQADELRVGIVPMDFGQVK